LIHSFFVMSEVKSTTVLNLWLLLNFIICLLNNRK
jgi:hypothetical protein